jgi:hypothetical protein
MSQAPEWLTPLADVREEGLRLVRAEGGPPPRPSPRSGGERHSVPGEDLRAASIHGDHEVVDMAIAVPVPPPLDRAAVTEWRKRGRGLLGTRKISSGIAEGADWVLWRAGSLMRGRSGWV